MNQRRAFTLIELLVVAGIILLLIALLLPAVGKGKKLADQLTCLARVRAWGVGLQGYIGDNNGKYPNRDGGVSSWFGKAGQGGYGAEGLQADDRPLNSYVGGPYAPTAEVPEARCPRDRYTTPVFGSVLGSTYDKEGASYYGNGPVSTMSGNWNPSGRGLVTTSSFVNKYGRNEYYARKASEVVDASRMVAIAEIGAYNSSWWTAAKLAADGGAYNWHDLNAWNIAFADGGARSVRTIPGSFTNELYTFDFKY